MIKLNDFVCKNKKNILEFVLWFLVKLYELIIDRFI